MATRRGPADEWVDPDDFDRATVEAAAADPALAELGGFAFTDPESTKVDPQGPDEGATAEGRDVFTEELHRPTIGEILADAGQVDPEPTLDDRSFGGGARPGSIFDGDGPTDDVRLGPELLPRPDGASDSFLSGADEPGSETDLEDAFGDAFGEDFDEGQDRAFEPDELLDDEPLDDPTDPFS